MKTSLEWWESIKNDSTKIDNWLKKQYHGEAMAAVKIQHYMDLLDDTTKEHHVVISKIIAEEVKHTNWIKSLLKRRGITAELLEKEERYWDKTEPVVLEERTFSYFCAVCYHAETMRLERIRTIANDKTASRTITDIFSLILGDELGHSLMFQFYASEEDLAKAKVYHQEGCKAIGLVI